MNLKNFKFITLKNEKIKLQGLFTFSFFIMEFLIAVIEVFKYFSKFITNRIYSGKKCFRKSLKRSVSCTIQVCENLIEIIKIFLFC